MKLDLTPYRAIACDFDGVVIDAVTYKHGIFVSLFSDFPGHTAAIETYNWGNRGVNRIPKFTYIYKNILKLPFSDDQCTQLADLYGERLAEHYLECPLIAGVEKFLSSQTLPRFIVSSSPVKETEPLLIAKNVRQYFEKVFGFPPAKPELLHGIIAMMKIDPGQLLFLGDAKTDEAAARTIGTGFVGVNTDATVFPEGTACIRDFREIED